MQNALTLIGNNSGTEWLKNLDKQGNVEWSKVQNAYHGWNYEKQSLNPTIAAVIAVAVAAATSGTTLASIAGNGLAAGTTAGTTSNAILYGIGSQGLSALVSKAAVSLVENKGNISKTLQALGSNDSVKSIATSMAVGGAMAGFDKYLGASSQALKNGEKLILTSNGNWNQIAQSVVGHSVIDAGINSAINGGSFKDRFADALLANVGNQLNAESAHFIGQHGDVIGIPGKFISHAATSALAAEIGGGNGKGAAAGALGAELAALALNDYFVSQNYTNEQIISVTKVAGAITAGILIKSPDAVYSGANAAHIVIEHNFLHEYVGLDSNSSWANNADSIIHADNLTAEEAIQALNNLVKGSGIPNGSDYAELWIRAPEQIGQLLPSPISVGMALLATTDVALTGTDKANLVHLLNQACGDYLSGSNNIASMTALNSMLNRLGIGNINNQYQGYIKDKILATEWGKRPDPTTYMSKAEIEAHLAKFDDGAIRFTSKAKYKQYGTYGPKDGFVMPRSEFDIIMLESKGNLRIVEQKLGLEKGYLSNSDTIAIYIKKEDFSGLKIPSGNESGVNQYWRPGGKTSGGVSEATLDFSKISNVGIIDLEKIKISLSGK